MEMKQFLQRFHLASQHSFQTYKLHQLYDIANHVLEKGIEILQINSGIWMNDQTADLKVIDSCTESTMDLNLKIRNEVKLDISIIGLENVINSCYMNASIQLIFNVPELIQKVHTLRDKPFVKEICLLINNTSIYNTETLKKIRRQFFNLIKLKVDEIEEQQDAHEFLNFILDQLNWNPLKMCVSIQDSEGNRLIDEPASHLQMTIHSDDDKTPLALQEMINRYTQPEDIDQCRKEVTQIKNSSDYLFLHLVRGVYNNINQTGKKKNNPLIHGLHESLKVGEDEYQVIGWINHIGSTMDSGHYTSIINRDGSWIHYNDDTVKSIAPISIDEGAYIVLLKKLT
jgi:ubiquitin C-terminal hydrolase